MAELPFDAFPSMRLEVPLAGLPTNSTCRNNSHSVFLDAMHHCYCNTSCFYYMKDMVDACQDHWKVRNENHWEKRILFRGSKAQYPTEKCGFRRISEADQRMRILNNLLAIAAQIPGPLIAEYNKDDSDHIFADADENDADAEENDADAKENLTIAMRATIAILAIIQHYADVLNDTLNEINHTENKTYIATPALDCTKDLRVAASFAIDKNRVDNQGTVRLLVLPSCTPYEAPVQRFSLGDTSMRLIYLKGICPFFAMRPTTQTDCCLLVHDKDLDDFHTLRTSREPVRLGQTIVNDTEEWNPPNLDNLNKKIRRAIHSLVNGEGRHWDALQWNQYNVRIRGDVTAGNDYFHKNIDGEAVTFLSTEARYPSEDRMKTLMEGVAKRASGRSRGNLSCRLAAIDGIIISAPVVVM